ncbi:Transcription elongation factor, GreA/GreB family [Modicisalibacter muralis]|uniref:Transcription elongation factor, GreA/GreB family n=1 Tax=Modicisalibacter muralis TaxID=119000 RepID=A0A1G9RDC6_9GAMM|nr:GreA/GreB family elongation factor [Halomonas muralis]SDM21171.1 Transcription elongation factor, GreA/GreB family [Halomonas muralis]
MSRAFVKEDSDAPESLPERTISDLPNYMTPSGHDAIQQRLAELIAERDALVTGDLQDRSQLPMLERDIRYFQARLQSAQVIEPRDALPGKVIFGCWVSFVDSNGEHHRYRIVGEDEALEHGSGHHHLISWASPLGRALLGAAIGDTVTWPKPSGDLEIEITDIEC